MELVITYLKGKTQTQCVHAPKGRSCLREWMPVIKEDRVEHAGGLACDQDAKASKFVLLQRKQSTTMKLHQTTVWCFEHKVTLYVINGHFLIKLHVKMGFKQIAEVYFTQIW